MNQVPEYIAWLRSQYKRLPVWLRNKLGRVSTAFFGLTWRWKLSPVASSNIAAGSPPEAAGAVTILSILSTPSGVGGAARTLGRYLDRHGLHVSYIDAGTVLGYPTSPDLVGDKSLEPAHLFSTTRRTIIFQLDPSQIARTIPWLPIQIGPHDLRIGYWAWELDEIPLWWKKLAPRVHEIWVPSEFVAAAARKALPDCSIYVVPHVIDPPTCSPCEALSARARVRERLKLDATCFVAGYAFSMRSSMARKNPLAAIAAFELAFPSNQNACLILRCLDVHTYAKGYAQLQSAIGASVARIILVGPEVTIFDLYQACDVYLSLHRSEGFGLTIAEAMAHGRPVIATNWSGNCDFVDGTCGILVEYRLVPVVDPQNIFQRSSGLWAEPNALIAANALQTLANDRDTCTRLGEAARLKIMQHGRGDAIMARLNLPAAVPEERELNS